MENPYQAAPDVHVLPVNLPFPGVGYLPINSFVLTAEEPVLVDTGIGNDRADFLAALSSIVDPADLRWIWLTHDDSDHTGSIQQVMEAAPNARLACNAMAALRMATWWPLPFERVHAMRVGDRLPVGDRTLRAVAPPLYDSPVSTGFVDESTGALFSVDSFGALIPAPTQNADDVPREALAGGMTAWATFDSPWTHLLDRTLFGQVMDSVRALAPSHIFSSHLPAASGNSFEQLCAVVQSIPDATPAIPPSHEEFTQMLQAMMAAANEAAGAAT